MGQPIITISRFSSKKFPGPGLYEIFTATVQTRRGLYGLFVQSEPRTFFGWQTGNFYDDTKKYLFWYLMIQFGWDIHTNRAAQVKFIWVFLQSGHRKVFDDKMEIFKIDSRWGTYHKNFQFLIKKVSRARFVRDIHSNRTDQTQVIWLFSYNPSLGIFFDDKMEIFMMTRKSTSFDIQWSNLDGIFIQTVQPRSSLYGFSCNPGKGKFFDDKLETC